ncbi:MAG: hypothetical protein RLZZ244_2332 [Verrucomicrobiota bacterium]
MRLEVLNTGSELLLGQVQNTHLAFLATSLFPLGLAISRQTTVPDGPAIRDALQETFGRADIVLVTGGLGPTTDDITRETTAALLGLELVHDPEVEAAILARFHARGIPVTPRVLRQAMKPTGAEVLKNPFGTAPGLYLPPQSLAGVSTPHLFLLPGPPRELQPMVETAVIQKLRSLLPPRPDQHLRTWRVLGIPESTVEATIGEALIARGIEPGYCARLGEVDIRVVGSTEQIEAAEALIQECFSDAMLPSGARPLEEWLVEEMSRRQYTLATAESCTGGFIAHRITNVPGASAVLLSGWVTYSNASKIELGVPAELIEQQGAVSEAVAAHLAGCARKASGATHALAATGIAGPGGAVPHKPQGTVFIALSAPEGVRVEKHQFRTDRLSFKQLASQTALDMLRRSLMNLA